MNREILFKAKRIDNGEWVEGAVLPACNGAYIATSFLEGDSDEPLIVAAYEVVPETVCQYTGLTDRDGKKIWENDIISISAYSYDEPEDDYFGVVTYCEKDACWSLNNNEKYGEIICECFGSYTTEIINHGNIFDNPELLEVE